MLDIAYISLRSKHFCGVWEQRKAIFSVNSYLRTRLIFSRYPSSHACLLMARIPETTWLIKEMRWSETTAVRTRSLALTKDKPAKYGTRRHRKKNPISACQPMKNVSNSETTTSSGSPANSRNVNFTTSCSNR